MSKPQTFCQIFITLLQSAENFADFEKKIGFIASIFGRLLSPRNVVIWMPEKSQWIPFKSQCVHGSQTPLESARQHFYLNFSLIRDKLSQEASMLFRSQILGPFGHMLTVDRMYSRHNWEKFPQHAKTPLSQNHQHFLKFLFHFWNRDKILRFLKKKSSLID